MDNRVRVLQIIAGMGSGGAEKFLMNMYRNMDHDKIVFDFLLQSDDNLYKDELESYGSVIYQIPPYYRHPIKNRAALKSILERGYSVIHVHANALMYITPILLAKELHIPCRIMHSHNTSLYYKWMRPYHVLNKHRIKNSASHRFACSEKAGEWMFDSDYTVVRNAIDLEAFAFKREVRDVYRQELGISKDDLVIGQIGRLWEVKNQTFTLDVLKQILEKRDNCQLLFVGEGMDEADLQNKARLLGIDNHVSFLGVRKDVSDLINAFDILMLPSLYEGLPMVMIESQANGLPVFCSENVTEESVVSTNVFRLSLDLGAAKWARLILETDTHRIDNRSWF